MSPAAKFNALLCGLTVSLMFLLVAWASPRLAALGADNPIALSASGLVLSAGVYRLLTIGVRWVMERSTTAAKLVLGPHFVHGTWVGWFDGHSGERRYMVEHFSQDLDGLVITGRSFDINLKEHGYWESEAAVVDAKRGKLIFTYKFDVLTRQISLFGIHTSFLARQAPHLPAIALSGFAHDLNDATRIAVHSRKITEDLASWDSSLQEAVKLSAGDSKRDD
ncbi:hypothetical protein [Corticimicrobacter populi]|uniref:SMODS-associating 2TM beta-strand rich effector domain-containing protein n=1 Tax=Corticimicrobacter populi TaxID=2175229 RepID=A0A2V1K1I5_9BURK|nr:hypothetical protein [Corticimicrobacter populi]PWF23956.1 hypothetical protein DD235_06395 [Corticimicrobacter populi]